jgi:prephenate dehydrogenase
MRVQQLGLIGCGLMGGSFALALKQAGLVDRVVAFSPSAESVQIALSRGVIDQPAAGAAEAAVGSDLVVLAVPVAATRDTLERVRSALDQDALVMDVGSTKSDVVLAARLGLKESFAQFVPAHPIAGKEVSGVQHADPALYAGQQVILTPVDQTLVGHVQRAQAVWTALGCQVRLMSPRDHDAALAAVSHLPHLLAFAYINSVLHQSSAPEHLSLAGPGFRDFTRIAASDPQVWRDILMANASEVLAYMQGFKLQLQMLEQALQQAAQSGSGAELMRLIEHASQYRAQWLPGQSAT